MLGKTEEAQKISKKVNFLLIKKCPFSYESVYFMEEWERGLVVGTSHGLVHIKPAKEYEFEVVLPGHKVSSFFLDYEGGRWYTSLNKGLFYSPSPRSYIQYMDQNLNCIAFDSFNACVWIGGIGQYFRFDLLSKQI